MLAARGARAFHEFTPTRQTFAELGRIYRRCIPSDRRFGLQFFGHVAIDGADRTMTVTLKDVADDALWSITLPPQPDRWSRSSPPLRI
jgi:phosphodiesterase/alkaline phosphatase D-like protein